MDLTPDTWLAAAVDVLGRAPNEKNFKVLGGTVYGGPPGPRTVRILNRNTGEVWVFVCSVERGPA